jgi:hypothetical protein
VYNAVPSSDLYISASCIKKRCYAAATTERRKDLQASNVTNYVHDDSQLRATYYLHPHILDKDGQSCVNIRRIVKLRTSQAQESTTEDRVMPTLKFMFKLLMLFISASVSFAESAPRFSIKRWALLLLGITAMPCCKAHASNTCAVPDDDQIPTLHS